MFDICLMNIHIDVLYDICQRGRIEVEGYITPHR